MTERYRIHVPWGAIMMVVFIAAAPHLLMGRWNELATRLPAPRIDLETARIVVSLTLIIGGLLTAPVWGLPRTVTEKDGAK